VRTILPREEAALVPVLLRAFSEAAT
jgi:hypothetical protein